MKKMTPFPTKIGTKFQPICLECISNVLLLADLESMHLDYLYHLDRMRRNKEYREARSVRNMNKIKEDLDIKNRVSPYNELTICLSVCLIWFSFTGSVADPH